MKKLKIAMLGAGSGFVMSVAKELIAHEIFNGSEFVLQDISRERLRAAEGADAVSCSGACPGCGTCGSGPAAGCSAPSR